MFCEEKPDKFLVINLLYACCYMANQFFDTKVKAFSNPLHFWYGENFNNNTFFMRMQVNDSIQLACLPGTYNKTNACQFPHGVWCQWVQKQI